MNWKTLPDPHPYAVVQAIPYDGSGRFLAMLRGANVRSAPGVWSFPSGLHECGLTFADQMVAELKEETALVADPKSWEQCFTYENAPGDGWHWVIVFGMIRVENLDAAQNLEPDKHDELSCFPIDELHDPAFALKFHPSFQHHLLRERHKLARSLYTRIS